MDITLPPEVEEAAQQKIITWLCVNLERDTRAHAMTASEIQSMARAAIAAGLAAWPGAWHDDSDVGFLILPLAQEPPHDR